MILTRTPFKDGLVGLEIARLGRGGGAELNILNKRFRDKWSKLYGFPELNIILYIFTNLVSNSRLYLNFHHVELIPE